MDEEFGRNLASAKSIDGKICYVDFSRKSASVKHHKKQSSKSSLSSYPKVFDEVVKNKPQVPVNFIRPDSIKRAAQFFLNNFNGEILYSVKSNPDEAVLQHLFATGVKHYDVASLPEVKMIDRLFGKDVKMYFMHPIKSRQAIYEAYFNFGIRDFSFDCADELNKILEVTNNAKDLGLHLRLSIPNSHAAIDLSGKFGILPSKAPSLLRKTRTVAQRLGICFHVGSQCMEPTEYRSALTIAKEVLEKAKVRLDVIDVGGGFPSSYPGLTPPAMSSYFDEIHETLQTLPIDKNCKLWCEPGRALVAESGSLLVKVEARKDNSLYINDGIYGGLFDAGHLDFAYPTKAIRLDRQDLSSELLPFSFYGPTCDSLDVIKGPFYLPKNIKEGDYIEIGQLGAYSKNIRTNFNGFGESLQIEVCDEPFSSMYLEDSQHQKGFNSVSK